MPSKPKGAAMISFITGANQDYIETEPDITEAHWAHWRAALDALWHRKLDEVVSLSTACAGITSLDDDRIPDRAVLPSLRLPDRARRAFEGLAAIEDAMARVDDRTYGLCAACGHRMPEEWLAEDPPSQHCPDCALQQMTWRSSSAPRSATRAGRVAAIVPHPAPVTCPPHQPSARRATAVLPLPA